MPVKLPPGPVTLAIVIGTALVWVLLWLSGWLGPATMLGGFIPARVFGSLVLPGAVPVWLTPLTATLLHADLLHIGFNMFMLIFCGRFVESAIGGAQLVALYAIGAFAAALAQFAIGPASQVPMIGASGAISAVVGAYAVLFGQQKVRAIGPFSPFMVRIAWLAAAWIAVQSLIELASFGTPARIAVAAHVGGFIAGLLLARPLLLFRYRSA